MMPPFAFPCASDRAALAGVDACAFAAMTIIITTMITRSRGGSG